ncbi:MAG: hypothetical protein ABJH85_01130 [Paracoccaceae bacterium]
MAWLCLETLRYGPAPHGTAGPLRRSIVLLDDAVHLGAACALFMGLLSDHGTIPHQ